MKVTVDIAIGGVGMDESKLRSKGKQPMMDMPEEKAEGDPKFEIGYDAGAENDSWTGNFTPPTEEYAINKVKKFMGVSNV